MNVRDAWPGRKVVTIEPIEVEGVIIERFPWVEATKGTLKKPGTRDVPVMWLDGTIGYIDVSLLEEKEDE